MTYKDGSPYKLTAKYLWNIITNTKSDVEKSKTLFFDLTMEEQEECIRWLATMAYGDAANWLPEPFQAQNQESIRWLRTINFHNSSNWPSLPFKEEDPEVAGWLATMIDFNASNGLPAAFTLNMLIRELIEAAPSNIPQPIPVLPIEKLPVI